LPYLVEVVTSLRGAGGMSDSLDQLHVEMIQCGIDAGLDEANAQKHERLQIIKRNYSAGHQPIPLS
jgi:hypothetical protein